MINAVIHIDTAVNHIDISNHRMQKARRVPDSNFLSTKKMQPILLVAGCFIAVLAVSSFSNSPQFSFAQKVGQESSITVKSLDDKLYVFRGTNGAVTILGMVENTNDFAVTNARLAVKFFDKQGDVVESKTAGTILDTIPAKSTSPFVAKSSQTSGPKIASASAKVNGFNSAQDKPAKLDIKHDTVIVEQNQQFILQGNITNKGTVTSANTRIHLVLHDSFGRVIGLFDSIVPKQGKEIQSSAISDFEVSGAWNGQAKSYTILAESNQYLSAHVSAKDITIQKQKLIERIKVQDISITNATGASYDSIPLNDTVHITPVLKIQSYHDTLQNPQDYRVYAQIKDIKQEGGGTEFVGKTEGTFTKLGTQSPVIEWRPQTKGGFYVEIFVWDKDNVPLAPPSSKINLVLVQ